LQNTIRLELRRGDKMRQAVPVSRFSLKFEIYKTGESTRRGVVDEQKTAGF